MSWDGKRVLVTGAGGFIGSHLVERLVSLGASVTGFVHYNASGSWGWLDRSLLRSEVQVAAGDLADRDSLRQAMQGAGIVFHLGALIAIPYSYSAPASYVRTNVEGSLNVLQCARDLGVERVLHTSTSEVYGTAQYVPISEDHPLQGQSPYSATKIGADKLAEAFHLSFGLPVVTIRPFNTYGPRQSARAVIPAIIAQALTQDEIHLGRLDPTRDFNYVADTVAGFVCGALCPQAIGDVFNIGTGREISIGDLARLILKLVGKDIPIVSEQQRLRPEGSEVERLCADSGKAQRVLDWRPAFTLEAGLLKTIEWIETNLEHYRPDIYHT